MALFNFKKRMEDDMYCSCCGCATNAPVDESIEQGSDNKRTAEKAEEKENTEEEKSKD